MMSSSPRASLSVRAKAALIEGRSKSKNQCKGRIRQSLYPQPREHFGHEKSDSKNRHQSPALVTPDNSFQRRFLAASSVRKARGNHSPSSSVPQQTFGLQHSCSSFLSHGKATVTPTVSADYSSCCPPTVNLNEKLGNIENGLGEIEEERMILLERIERLRSEKDELKRSIQVRENDIQHLTNRCNEQASLLCQSNCRPKPSHQSKPTQHSVGRKSMPSRELTHKNCLLKMQLDPCVSAKTNEAKHAKRALELVNVKHHDQQYRYIAQIAHEVNRTTLKNHFKRVAEREDLQEALSRADFREESLRTEEKDSLEHIEWLSRDDVTVTNEQDILRDQARQLELSHKQTVESMRASHEKQLQATKDYFLTLLQSIKTETKQQIDEMKDEHADRIREMDAMLVEKSMNEEILQTEISNLMDKLMKMSTTYHELKQERALVDDLAADIEALQTEREIHVEDILARDIEIAELSGSVLARDVKISELSAELELTTA